MTLPRPPKAVVFDLDGTLIDSELLVRDSYFHAAGEHGVTMSEDQFKSLIGFHRDANDSQMRAFYGADFPLEDFYATARTWLGERVAPLKPGALELMDALEARDLPFALATSSGRPWVDRHFAAHKLGSRFRAAVARGEYVNAKPHPEPYLTAAKALGVAPEFTLALEDSPTGLAAAHAAGMMTVIVPDMIAPTDEMRGKAVCVVASLHDVIALLD